MDGGDSVVDLDLLAVHGGDLLDLSLLEVLVEVLVDGFVSLELLALLLNLGLE